MLPRPEISLRVCSVSYTIISTRALITFLTSVFLRFPNMHSSFITAVKCTSLPIPLASVTHLTRVCFLESDGIICPCNLVYQQTAYVCFSLCTFFSKSNLSKHSTILILHNLVNNSSTTAVPTALVTVSDGHFQLAPPISDHF